MHVQYGNQCQREAYEWYGTLDHFFATAHLGTIESTSYLYTDAFCASIHSILGSHFDRGS